MTRGAEKMEVLGRGRAKDPGAAYQAVSRNMQPCTFSEKAMFKSGQLIWRSRVFELGLQISLPDQTTTQPQDFREIRGITQEANFTVAKWRWVDMHCHGSTRRSGRLVADKLNGLSWDVPIR